MCSSKGQSTNAPLPIGTQIITAVPSENKSGSSIGIALGGVAVGIAIIAVIGYFVLQQKLSSRSLPIEGQPIDTPSSVSTPYIVPMASVRPISTSVVGLRRQCPSKTKPVSMRMQWGYHWPWPSKHDQIRPIRSKWNLRACVMTTNLWMTIVASVELQWHGMGRKAHCVERRFQTRTRSFLAYNIGVLVPVPVSLMLQRAGSCSSLLLGYVIYTT
jgi:hypothetical protein